jgi:hypothetical protein
MVSTVGYFTASALTFLPGPHEYRLPDGRVVPGVTSILKAVGASTDFDAIAASSRWRAEKIVAKRDLGSLVHLACHAFDDDDLDWRQVPDDVRPYVEAWAQFRENSRLRPLERERKVFHPGFFYAGMLDGIFAEPSPTERRILLDIKTGDPSDSGAHLQTAAYEAAHTVEHPDMVIHERWSVQLIPGARVPYRTTNYTARPHAWQDFSKFQACVAVYNEQPVRLKRLS